MNIRIMFFFIIQIVQYVVNSMSNRFVAYHHLSSFHLQYVFSCFSFPHWREKCQAAKFPTSLSRDFNHDWNVENMQKRWRADTETAKTTGPEDSVGEIPKVPSLSYRRRSQRSQEISHSKLWCSVEKKTYVHIYIYIRVIWKKLYDVRSLMIYQILSWIYLGLYKCLNQQQSFWH